MDDVIIKIYNSTMKRYTSLHKTRYIIDWSKRKYFCPDCGTITNPKDNLFECPNCHCTFEIV